MKILFSCLLLATVALATTATGQRIDLSGQWKVDLGGKGTDGPIELPSTLDMAGYGNPVDTVSLTRDEQFRRLTRRYSYIGPATYSRKVEITPEMAGKPLELTLERVLWKSEASIGGKAFDNEAHSLVAPHRHVLMAGLPQGTHELKVTVDNSRQYDISFDNLAHSYTNDTQTMWNGILGEISLRAIPQIDVTHVEVYPSETLDFVTVKAYVDNHAGRDKKKQTVFRVGDVVVTKRVKYLPGPNVVTVRIPVEEMDGWNEFNPSLHEASVAVEGEDSASVTFGMRTLGNKGCLTVNGTPIFLRGTLECCVFPLTGVPATTKEGWAKTFTAAKEWGLNHMRFHSWCPPEAAFEVADSMGFYLQVELPVWSLKVGDDESVKQFMREEYENIVSEYGNHPSLCFISCGNELQYDFDFLTQLVWEMRARDPRHLYTASTFTFEKGHGGHPEPADQYFVTQWTNDGWVRGQGVFEKNEPAFDRNYAASMGCVDVPLVSHEIGQYATFPSMKEIDKYTGVLNPLNFKNIREDLRQKGLLGQADSMTMSSTHWAALLYKEEIERAMKTPGFSGYQLLGLQDFPGQGTALIGLVDAFWDNKGAVEPQWFRQFCGPVVALANFPKAVYSPGEDFEAVVAVSNHGATGLEGDLQWSLTVEGSPEAFASGTVHTGTAAAGAMSDSAVVKASLDKITEPSAVVFALQGDGFGNSWRIHVYPEREVDYGDVVVTRSPSEADKALREGKDVLLAAARDSIEGLKSKFLPVFWSPVHFPKEAGPMGIMCDPAHPALKGFPNTGNTDWQWWRLVRNAKVMDISGVEDAKPIVSVIDNFVNNRRLAYVYEAERYGRRLVVCSFDLLDPEIQTPEVKAFTRSLVESFR